MVATAAANNNGNGSYNNNNDDGDGNNDNNYTNQLLMAFSLMFFYPGVNMKPLVLILFHLWNIGQSGLLLYIQKTYVHLYGILPKEPYLPCVSIIYFQNYFQ